MMTINISIELTSKQLDKIASLRAEQVGRENPRKAWTDQERKQYARELFRQQIKTFINQHIEIP